MKGLGVRHILIDSLCTIQDSEEYWRRDSAEMGLIYEKARHNIAAAGAAEPSRGCFLLHCSTDWVIELPYYDSSGTYCEAFCVSEAVKGVQTCALGLPFCKFHAATEGQMMDATCCVVGFANNRSAF